ncbi:MAG: hypothetical protein K2O40_03160, partial [Lachnospiraceae bacterium]|nr:hypothetical protein [Lachnospiraceae bacterium]
GFFLRKRIFLHESNRVVGKSIRILSYFAEKVYLPSGVKFRSKYLNKKVEHIGYPLRAEFKIFDKVAARESIGTDPLKRLILVIGGSQGAKILTDWAQENYEILNHHGILVYCITGRFDKKIHEYPMVSSKIINSAPTGIVQPPIVYCVNFPAFF